MSNVDPVMLGLILTAIGWVSREIWRRRQARRQAASDAGKILGDKKKLLEDMVSKTEDSDSKKALTEQLDEVNAALRELYSQRLRQTLKEAGLPSEEELIADGRSRLQPQQASRLEEVVEELSALPVPLSANVLRMQGNAYYYAEQYQDAKDIYDRILNLNPNDPTLLNDRGVTYVKMGKHKEALADFNRSLELSPDDSNTLSNRGRTYDELGKYEEALTDYNRSLELRPDHPDTLNNRGITYRKIGKYKEALAGYNRSLELRPDHPVTLNNRGRVYGKMGKYKESLADHNHSLELEPDNPSPMYNLARLFSLWGKPDDALAYLKRAIGGDEKYLEKAKTDEDFDNIRDDPRFKKLIGLE